MVAIPRKIPAVLMALLLIPMYGAGRGPKPRGGEPAESLPATPQALDEAIHHAEGLDATLWGQDTPNPFTDLTAEQIAAFKAHNVDIPRLQKMRAVLIMGNYCGANRRDFVNLDPNVILVFGEAPQPAIKYLVFAARNASLPPLSTQPARRRGTANPTPEPVVSTRPFVPARWPPATLPAPKVVKGPPAPPPAPTAPPAPKPPAPPVIISTAAPQSSRLPDNYDDTPAPSDSPTTGPAIRVTTRPTTAPARHPRKSGITPTPESRASIPSRETGPVNHPEAPLEEKPYDHNFNTHGNIYSLGPIVFTGAANHMPEFNIIGADLTWFQVKDTLRFRAPWSDNLAGAPLVISAPPRKKDSPDLVVTQSESAHSFAYSPPNAAPGRAERPHPRATNREHGERPQIDAATFGLPAANPFTHITPDGLAKLKARGIDTTALSRMRAVLISGSFCGAQAVDFVNPNPNLIVIIGNGFITHGTVTSAGPILATGNANFMNAITGKSLVWFVNKSFPRGPTTGKPIIMAPNAIFSQTQFITDNIWHGDYGWRPPGQP